MTSTQHSALVFQQRNHDREGIKKIFSFGKDPAPGLQENTKHIFGIGHKGSGKCKIRTVVEDII